MPRLITIRAERPEDAPAIASLVIRAYAAIPYSDHREHLMIERLRESSAYIPGLALVAEADGAAVGHILLSRATIGTGHSAAPSLALAPLSVVPEYQRRSVGRQLVGAAHRRAAGLGFGSVLVVGNPDYYAQFGYRRLSDFPITLPFAAPAANCMILGLKPGALERLAGQVHYAAAWLDH